ncbi:MAG TPA: radical SAM family heme chaperone HemW [Bacteroidales bacterium]
MAGIYVHIPFCEKRCYYCDFYSVANKNKINDFIEALISEIKLKQGFFHNNNEPIKTIYFGGGTPSVLSTGQLEIILNEIATFFDISEVVECTIEVNPDDINAEYVKGLKSIGFNRVSIGIQSFDNGLLKLMNRRHSKKDAIKAVYEFYNAGINNISVDLIYGLPGTDEIYWENTLLEAFKLPMVHLSAYCLSYEEGTVFYNWYQRNKIQQIPEEMQWKQYQLLHEISMNNGFEHYEISNLSKPGYKSKHNSSYWQGVSYLGLGPAAHSFNGHARSWNIADIGQYIDLIRENKTCREEENLSESDQFNEYLMTRLRTSDGISIAEMKQKYQPIFTNDILNEIKNRYSQYFESINEERIAMNLEGWFVSDSIIAGLMK